METGNSARIRAQLREQLVISAIYWSLGAISAGLLAPAFVLFVECAAAAWPPARAARPRAGGPRRPSLAVLIPAHDEERSLGATLEALRPQLRSGDRLLVVADNCSDGTGDVARRAGAELATREDPSRRGKGHALRFGLDALRERPPELVVVIDADCLAEPGSLDALALASSECSLPAQACYSMRQEAGSALTRFAFLVKNHVRPLGLRRLGLPCQLTGTGMAFPWPLIDRVRPAAESLVEDLQLGVDLARAGHPPVYVPEAKVTSVLPEGRRAVSAQRRRWEHGHLETLLRAGPRLLIAGLRERRPGVVALAADLCVPPLALLAWLEVGVLAAALAAALAGAGALPLALTSFALFLTGGAIALAWLGHGRSVVSGRALLGAPLYVAAKLPLYLGFLWRRQRDWVRTERER
jgi:cellulose synthase/poly-beta-1,6-N-acetylglucosamine synthase-like glycosyltransferase